MRGVLPRDEGRERGGGEGCQGMVDIKINQDYYN